MVLFLNVVDNYPGERSRINLILLVAVLTITQASYLATFCCKTIVIRLFDVVVQLSGTVRLGTIV